MIWNWITYHARQRPDAVAAELTGHKIAYAGFAADIARASEALRAALPPSARLVGIRVSHSYLHLVVMVALMRLRVASASLLDDRAAEIAAADALVVDQGASADGLAIKAPAEWMGNQARPDVLAVRDPDDDFDIRLIMSSGTTGLAKKIMMRAEMARQHSLQYAICGPMNGQTRAHVQMAVDTSAGFLVPCGVLISGGALVVSRNPFFDDRIAIEAKPNLCVISTGDLAAFVRRTEGREQMFANTRFLCGGSATPKQLMERARKQISADINIIYGATETGLTTMETRHDERIPQGSVGFTLPLAEIQVVDEHDTPLPPRTEGQVRARAVTAVRSYVDDEEATAQHFRDGWFYPGDLGTFAADGMLVITGRTVEMFNFGGMKVAPIRIEDAALECAGVEDAGVCALKDAEGPIAALGIVASAGYDKAALVDILARKFVAARFAVVELSAIPRNNMDKISRRELAKAIFEQAAGAAAPSP